MKLRDYQHESVDFLVSRTRGMVVAPAGAGKTVIGAHAVRQLRDRGLLSFAWLANTREQVAQAEAALTAAGVTGGLVCCMMARPSLQDVHLVVVDESHHAPAAVWSEVIGSAPPWARVWGLTATPFGEDEDRNEALRQYFQDFIFIDRGDVMAGGHLVPGVVRPVDLETQRGIFDEGMKAELELNLRRQKARFRFVPEHELRKRLQWKMTLEHMQNNLIRNAAIVALAKTEMARGEVVIVLVSSIEHGERLAEQIEGSACIHSKLPKKRRDQLTLDLREGRLRCAVATSLMDEGADFPVASVLILATGGRSSTKTIQRAGRVMRPHAGKTCGVVYDFVDRGLSFAHAQWRARLRTYNELGYTVEDSVSYEALGA